MKIKISIIVVLAVLFNILSTSATNVAKQINKDKLTVNNLLVIWTINNFPNKTKNIKYSTKILLKNILKSNHINNPKTQEITKQSTNSNSNFNKELKNILNEKSNNEQKIKKSQKYLNDYLNNFLTKVKTFNTNKDEISVGSFKQGEMRIVNFTLKNTTKNILKIKQLRKTCGCAKVSSSTKEIKPNESAIITVKLLANEELYGPFLKSIYVVTNPQKTYKFTVIGNAGLVKDAK